MIFTITNVNMRNPTIEDIDPKEIKRRQENEADLITIQIARSEVDGNEITLSNRIRFWFKETKGHFNWDDFFFNLIFGLAPTAWDMYTDLELASHLLESENAHAAGLCYVFICLPGINLVKEQVY